MENSLERTGKPIISDRLDTHRKDNVIHRFLDRAGMVRIYLPEGSGDAARHPSDDLAEIIIAPVGRIMQNEQQLICHLASFVKNEKTE